MAEVFYFHVQEDRSIKYKLLEPIMQEDKDVATWRFRIPKILNEIDMSAWAWWFVYGKGVTILGGSDLDDYVIPGVYAIEASSTAQNITHMPVAVAGRLEVRESIQDGTGLYIIQTFYRTNSVDAEIYHRVKTTASTGFGAWKKVAYAT